MDAVDWDALSERIADAALAQAGERKRERARERAPRPVARPVFSGDSWPGPRPGSWSVSWPTFFWLRRGPSSIVPGGAGSASSAAAGTYAASGEFIRGSSYELAKRETIDYLEKSEYVLLDLLEPRSVGGRTGGRRPIAIPAIGQALLLAQKRYFNAQLDDVRMAKARASATRSRFLFLELSQISRTPRSAEEAAEIQKYVEDKQLLLQIRLLKKELRENEA